jgi:uncharacterized damage-inducible protein DinB
MPKSALPAPSPKLPAAYLEPLEGKDALRSLAKAPRRLKKLLRSASERELAQRPSRGKWSVVEVLNHLADHEVIQGSRWRLVGAMERPPIHGYDQEAFQAAQDLEGTRAKDLWRAFAAARAANLAFLARLEPQAWGRLGLHSERGEESLSDMTWRCAGHDRIHEAQIERTLAALRQQPRPPRALPAKRRQARRKTAR